MCIGLSLENDIQGSKKKKSEVPIKNWSSVE